MKGAGTVATVLLLIPSVSARPVPADSRAPAPSERNSGPPLSTFVKRPGNLQSRIRFDHLTSADGLSQDSVFAILQDRRGFMWFGTQGGLNRYDGFRVTQYRHDPKKKNSLGNDFVQTLFEDSSGAIWPREMV